MKPYYDKDGITLYCADNRAVDWPEADFVLTDPPYSEATHDGARTNPGNEEGSSVWKSGGNEPAPLGIDFAPLALGDLDDLFARLGYIARRWVVSFLAYEHVVHLEAHEPPGLRFVRFGVWVKPNGAPQFTGDRPGTGWEGLAILHRTGGRLSWNGGGKHGVYTHSVAHTSHRISNHPNAKPIPLLIELIKDFSSPGDLVFDPYAGSGAVLAAAKLTGRRAVGIEREERHCEALAFWLDNARPRRGAVGALTPLEAWAESLEAA